LPESDGLAVTVEDRKLRSQQRLLGAQGLYGEAAAVASTAAIDKLTRKGVIDTESTIVAMHTSTGLKDIRTTMESLSDVPVIEPNLSELRTALGETYGISLPSTS